MRRRGLEPPPGYPGPGPQPCHPGVISVLCVQCVQIVRESGRIGRTGRSGCAADVATDRRSARGTTRATLQYAPDEFAEIALKLRNEAGFRDELGMRAA
jgi:hypothetical protein